MATQYKTTASAILQIVSDLRGETSTNTDANRIRALSRAYADFANRKRWKLYLQINQTVVGTGTADYTLGDTTYPAREKGLSEVYVETTGSTNMTPEAAKCLVVDFDEYKQFYNQNESEMMAYQYYDVANDLWKMHINPAPASTETATYSYYWTPPTLTTSADTVVCHDPMILARLTNAYLYEGEDEDKYQEQMQLAETLIGTLESNEDLFYPEQVKQINGPTTYGFGTY